MKRFTDMRNARLYLALAGLLHLCTANATIKEQELDYRDALTNLDNNPGRGFYRTRVLHLTEDGNKALDTWGNIVHLRTDISCFSNNAAVKIDKATGDTTFGVNQPVTEDALKAFEATLDGIRKRGKTAIVRVCYDPNYGGQNYCEPNDMELIKKHIKQFAEIYSRNLDVIDFVELGTFGPWGEMHHSNNGTNANIAIALQTLLENTPMELKVGVRRPDIVAEWMGLTKKQFDINGDEFKQAATAKGDTLQRVGMFNDGYLGSNSDLGTIDGTLTREMMVKWLETYSKNTPYGGELVANYNGDNPINTPNYLMEEGFRTHTSYLNYEWHQPTILGWKEEYIFGADPEYDRQTGYKYVEDHLGYRFVLRASGIEDICPKNELDLALKIQNVGFGNVCRPMKTTIVLKNEKNTYEIATDIDARTIRSKETAEDAVDFSFGVTDLQFSIALPAEVENGDYNVFLRISQHGNLTEDNNYQCIQFGNREEYFDKNIGANLIGHCTIERDESKAPLTEKRAHYRLEGTTLIIDDPAGKVYVYDMAGRFLGNGKRTYDLSIWKTVVLKCGAWTKKVTY